MVGGFQSSSARLSDVWLYSVVSRQWKEKATPAMQKATAFSSRGGHSACFLGSHLWVYGGYGGALYSRKDLEDVCTLNLETWTWKKVRMHTTLGASMYVIVLNIVVNHIWSSRLVLGSCQYHRWVRGGVGARTAHLRLVGTYGRLVLFAIPFVLEMSFWYHSGRSAGSHNKRKEEGHTRVLFSLLSSAVLRGF